MEPIQSFGKRVLGDRIYRVVAAILALILALGGLLAAVQTIGRAADEIDPGVASIAGRCADWLNEKADDVANLVLETGEIVVEQSRTWTASQCASRVRIEPGDYVSFSATVANTGQETLADLWLLAYWDPENPTPPDGIEYIPGAAYLFVNGDLVDLNQDWFANGHRIENVKPNDVITLKYTVRIADEAVVGSQIEMPFRVFADNRETKSRCTLTIV